jgi:hypothetical protein
MDCGGRAAAATPPWEERSDGVLRAIAPFKSAVAAIALPAHSKWTVRVAMVELMAGTVLAGDFCGRRQLDSRRISDLPKNVNLGVCGQYEEGLKLLHQALHK